MTAVADSLAPASAGADVLGHPKGLVTLAGTELWERISFHGMLALLTLYMAEQLFRPGHIEKIVGFAAFRATLESLTGPLSTEALAAQIFGLYIGLIYFTPVFGGLVGDRWIGRRNAVILGGVLMALGHFCMAFDQSFLLALVLLIAGAGFLRGNLIAQVGALYAEGDRRRGSGIQIYYAMVNVGGFVAPLITGALGQSYGWHFGFGFAGIGMLAGIAIYLFGARGLKADTPKAEARPREPLTPAERGQVLQLVLLLPLLTLFWVAQSQDWNVYNLWARDHVDLVVLGWKMPVPWVQSLAGVTSVAPVPLVLAFWRWLSRHGREPDDFGKLAIGCLMFAGFTALDGGASLLFGTGNKIPFLWIVFTNCGLAIGYLHVQPVAISHFSRTAPRSVNAMMVGVYFLSIFAGSLISGRLGGLYEQWSPTAFWLLHAAIVGAAGAGFLFASRLFRAAGLGPAAVTA